MAGKPRRRTSGGKPKRKPNRSLLAVVLGIVTSVLLLVALLLEAGLSWALVGVSALATAGAVRVARADAERERRAAAPRTRRRPAQQSSATRAKPGAAAPSAPGLVVACTQTGKPIDDCGCASRHVATADGAKRYGLPVGSPMGRKAKEPKVPTTSRAKPVPPGYAMRKTS